MSEELEFVDKSGQKVGRHDIIVYGHALGRSSGLRYGVVIGTRKSGPKVVLDIIPIDDDYGHCRELSKSSLQFGERTLVVTLDYLPERVKDLAVKIRKDLGWKAACTCESWYCGHALECPEYQAP